MLLTLVRHGETVENVEHIVQGHWPGRLTRRGQDQARHLADKLKCRQFDAIYSSDLKRCIDTTGYVRRYHIGTPFIADKNLREIWFGEFEGLKEAEVDWNKPVDDFWSYSRGGGETNRQLYERVLKSINRIYNKYPDGKVLVVTHGWPYRVVQSAITGQPLAELYEEWLDNCATVNYLLHEPLPVRPMADSVLELVQLPA